MATFLDEWKLQRLLSRLDRRSISAVRKLSCHRDARVTTRLVSALERPITGYGDLCFQRAVIEALGDIGDPIAVQQLVEIIGGTYYFGCSEYDRRELESAAVRSLGKIGDARAIPFLLDAAFYSESLCEVARNALDAFDWQPQDAKQAVLKHLFRPDWDERRLLECPDAIQLLCDHLRRVLYYRWGDEEDRIIALLGREGHEAAIDTLAGIFAHCKRLAEDYFKSGRYKKVVNALGRIGDPRCVDPLAKLVTSTEEVLGEHNIDASSARFDAMKAIARCGETGQNFLTNLMHTNPKYRDFAASVLESVGWRPRDQAECALHAFLLRKQKELVAMGDAAVMVLCKELDSHASDTCEDRDLEFAAVLLGEIRAKSAVEPLISAKRHFDSKPSLFSYEAILVALGKIGGQAAFEELVQVLGRHGSRYDDKVIEALSKLDGPRAVRPLLKAARTRASAKMAVSALTHILARNPQNIAHADLEEIRELDGLIQYEYVEHETFSGMIYTSTYERPVDCTELRNLAIQELARRKD